MKRDAVAHNYKPESDGTETKGFGARAPPKSCQDMQGLSLANGYGLGAPVG